MDTAKAFVPNSISKWNDNEFKTIKESISALIKSSESQLSELRAVLGVKHDPNSTLNSSMSLKFEQELKIITSLADREDRIKHLIKYKIDLVNECAMKMDRLRSAIKLHNQSEKDWSIISRILWSQTDLKIIPFLKVYYTLSKAINIDNFPSDVTFLITQFVGNACVAHCTECNMSLCLNETAHEIYNRLYSAGMFEAILVCHLCMEQDHISLFDAGIGFGTKSTPMLCHGDFYTLFGKSRIDISTMLQI